jgi:hypothetical protein
MNKTADSYQPGICNINTAETAKRRKLGHIGLSVFIVLLIVFLLMNVSRYYRVVLLLPALMGASGYLQARNHFCVGYAGAGMQNADESSTQASRIADKEARAQDKQKARAMNLQSAAIGIVLTAIAIILPHL